VYKIAGDYNSFLEFIKSLPSQPQPEVYGFHSNANITKESTEANRLLASLQLAVTIEDSKGDEKEDEEGTEAAKEKPHGEERQYVEGAEGEEGAEGVEGGEAHAAKKSSLMTSEEVMQNLSNDILHKLPRNFDLEQAQMKYPVTYYQSMNTVLCQVIKMFSKSSLLIELVHFLKKF